MRASPSTSEELFELLLNSRLFAPDEVNALRSQLGRKETDAKALAALLIEREQLTSYQARHLLKGRAGGFFLGKYKILEPLGQGGMGKVFRAQDTDLRRNVALKLLPQQTAQDERLVARFQREARLAAQLQHENIVRIYDVGEQRRNHFIAMELVEGRDLARLLEEDGRLQPSQATNIISQVAVGLDCAYRQGIIHRDIKPANILVTDNSTAKILDMGIARLLLDEASAESLFTRTGELMGTVDYMSPEQADDTRKADIRSDIYSLGCTLYHCLTGQVPFPEGSAVEKLRQHKLADPPRLSAQLPLISPSLSDLVFRMIAKSPDQRPQTPADVVVALKIVVQGSGAESLDHEQHLSWPTRTPDGVASSTDQFDLKDRLADRYEVLSLIGRGGMGEVYRARDTMLSREVAVKTLSRLRSRSLVAVKRFEREAKSLAALSHPNVLAVHDIGMHRDVSFVVMELLEGEPLRAVMARERVGWDRALEIAIGIAAGLEAAHTRGIIHRDIKPENVMILSDGRVKLVDFGLARLDVDSPLHCVSPDPSSNLSGHMMGTIPYMSPEQAAGKPLTLASDMFSLGVVLYELVTRQNPFRRPSLFGTLEAIVHESPRSPTNLDTNVPTALNDVILQLLIKDPTRRISSSQLHASLKTFHAGSPASADIVLGNRGTPPNTRCLGRERELKRLANAWDQTRAGEGRLICVVGEAGIGKTTLVESFFDSVRSSKDRCFMACGRCSERLGGSDGYLPFFEMLSELVSSDHQHRVAELIRATAPCWYAQLLPALTGSFEDNQFLEAQSSSQERMKRELVAFFENLSRQQNTVLFLDDFHWADVSSAELLTYLVTELRMARVLILCGYRPAELTRADNPLRHALLELQTRGISEELSLDFLSIETVKQYIHLEFPGHEFPADFMEVVHRRTEGNALFIVDLLRYLRESEFIVQEQGRWAVGRPLEDIEQHIPNSVRNMVQIKTEQLEQEDRRLLVTASVQGAEFDTAVVAKALGQDEWDVEERLEELARMHGLVRSVAEVELPDSSLSLRFAFVHVLYQNAFYETLTPARRAMVSTGVAQALSSIFQSRKTEISGRLAILYEAARDFASAAESFLQAAHNASNVSANKESINLAWRAIDMAGRLEKADRVRLTLASAFHIARLCQSIGRFDDAIQAFDLAAQTAARAGDTAARIEALCGKASTCFQTKQMGATRHLGSEAMRLAKEHDLELGLAQAESVLASERLCGGDFDQAERLYDRAIPILKQRGSLTHAMDASFFRFALHAWRMEFKEFEAGREWWLKQARSLGISPVPMHFFGAMALGNQGRLSDALAVAVEGRRLADLNNDAYHICRLPNVIGWLYRELGDVERAVSLDDESQKLGLEFGFEEAEANSRVNLAHDFITLGELDRAFEQLQSAEQIFERDVWFRWRYNIRLHAELARYWLARDDLRQAKHYAGATIELARQSTARKHLAWGRKLLADVLLKQGCVRPAKRELMGALRILDGHPCPSIDWRISAALADLARQTRDSRLEVQAHDRALRMANVLARSLDDEALHARFIQSAAVSAAGLDLS